jgi:hypothetical protein
MIDITKKYRTRNGMPVEILTTARKGVERPIVGLARNEKDGDLLFTWLADGRRYCDHEDRLDLIEINPYENWEIDAPVWARDRTGGWNPRHFAGVDNTSGRPLTWVCGQTSFVRANNKLDTIDWDELRLASEFTP